MFIHQGSSPLARGLLGDRDDGQAGVGIIPARAGFTRTSRSTCSSTRDHPRSRGVYGGQPGGVTTDAGSSPLARGLLRGGLLRVNCIGIIPARAGFTRSRTPVGLSAADHPRSRGVYGAVRAGWGQCRGIIPARAGFTSTATARTSLWMGSSPLARGLQVGRSGHRDDRGIIPARAGFTGTPHSLCGPVPDHPRSRGVYQFETPEKRLESGSSPLARGLRWGDRSDRTHRGIIPARAGFTAGPANTATTQADHPRSRGVYPCGPTGPRIMPGSSPLARGLRTRHR